MQTPAAVVVVEVVPAAVVVVVGVQRLGRHSNLLGFSVPPLHSLGWSVLQHGVPPITQGCPSGIQVLVVVVEVVPAAVVVVEVVPAAVVVVEVVPAAVVVVLLVESRLEASADDNCRSHRIRHSSRKGPPRGACCRICRGDAKCYSLAAGTGAAPTFGERGRF